MENEKKVPSPEEIISEKSPKSENPYGEGITIAMHILMHKDGTIGVAGAPMVMKYSATAYGVLKLAEKQLDLYYAKQGLYSKTLEENMRLAQSKFAFRNFISKFGRKK